MLDFLGGAAELFNYDTDGDGIPDAYAESIDTDGDGIADTLALDTDGDGMFDQFWVDMDGDGAFDAIGFDEDQNGVLEMVAYDWDGDGVADQYLVDMDGDGTFDASVTEFQVDTDGDGVADTVYSEVDKDLDGQADTVIKSYDYDGDGNMDYVQTYIDTDGDGVFDVALREYDVDSDGQVDTTETFIDLDGDGHADQHIQENYVDTDGDGRVDLVETLIDSDGDSMFDVALREYDTDGDGQMDTTETFIDLDGDGTPDQHIQETYLDTDGDGRFDTYVQQVDADADGAFEAVNVYAVDEDTGALELLYVDDGAGNGLRVEELEHFDPADSQSEDVVGDPAKAMEEWECQGSTNRCALFSQKFVIEEMTGRDIDIEEFADIAESNGWFSEEGGTPFLHMNKMLDLFGVDNEMTFHNGIDDIRQCLENGGRVIIAIDADEIWYGEDDDIFVPNDGANHAVEVVGIDYSDPDMPMVILNDSGHEGGCGEMIPLDTFMDAWEDSNCQMIACM